ncbi:GTPase Der [Vulcanimicrobium alpinum]|uniref:GTPase Der n=1 Tax=Vulcanimicrobium alpinum TaxID=3016050 RepID=A0AAN1XVL4_UNVUL|nr:ribosome biogenesis GTPase Der [Vulcanimicrobium alpinum]BDE05799.1 GTPase Der [Vulcanimicrobium alpinum]
MAEALAPSLRVRPATVAVVGRPNVGKSALFNRLLGQRLAIVEDTPGVTRDRLYALAEWRNRTFTLVDTGGIDTDVDPNDPIASGTRAQAESAARDADVVVFVVDAIDGLLPIDREVADILRRTRRPVILVANKVESPKALASVHAEFSGLGFGEPFAVSAMHGEGTGDLLDAIVEKLPPDDPTRLEQAELAIALIGQPNVGKSSLLNALLQEERAIVSDVPGTTRDAIDTLFTWKQRTFRLIDTAGVRKKAGQHGSIEYYSSLRSLKAIARCDIAVLLIDALKGPTNQDRRLAGIALEERKALVIVGNKYDLVRELGEYSQPELAKEIHAQLPFASFAPVTFLSALTKRRLQSLMPLVERVAENLDRRIPTAKLNTVVRNAVLAHPPPIHSGKPLKVFYVSQPQTHPPLFVFHVNDPEIVPAAYRRFIENTLRAEFDFEGVPLTFDFRERSGRHEEGHE